MRVNEFQKEEYEKIKIKSNVMFAFKNQEVKKNTVKENKQTKKKENQN